MKSWLAQGSLGRRVTLLPGTTFLYINGALENDLEISGDCMPLKHIAHISLFKPSFYDYEI